MLEEVEYQTELPVGEVLEKQPWFAWLGRQLTAVGSFLAGRVLLVVVGAAFLVVLTLLVLALARSRRDRGREAAIGSGPDETGEAEAAVPRRPPAELAAEGRFAEAIRGLLLDALDDLSRARRKPIAPALTSREIVRRIPLVGTATRELSGLVHLVERALFAGEEADIEWYRRGREHYERFLAARGEAAA